MAIKSGGVLAAVIVFGLVLVGITIWLIVANFQTKSAVDDLDSKDTTVNVTIPERQVHVSQPNVNVNTTVNNPGAPGANTDASGEVTTV